MNSGTDDSLTYVPPPRPWERWRWLRFSISGLRWTAGSFLVFLGLVALTVPHRLLDPADAWLRVHPLAGGAALLLGGGALWAATLLRPRFPGAAAAHLAAGVAFGALAAGAARSPGSAGSLGFLPFAAFAAGLVLTGLIPGLASQGPSAAARGDWVALLAGLAALLTGGAALLAPNGAVPGGLGVAPPAWAAATLAAAGLLLLASLLTRALRRRPRAALHVLAGAVAAAFPFAAGAAGSGLASSTGVWLMASGLAVAAWPFAGIWLERWTAATLSARFAWALFAAAMLPLCLAVGAIAGQAQRMVEEQEEAARLRTAEAIAGSLADAVELRRTELAAVAAGAGTLAFDPHLQEAGLVAGRRDHPQLDTLLLLDGERRVVAKAGEALAGEAVLQSAASPRLALDPGTPDPRIWLSALVTPAGGLRPGLLLGALRPADLSGRLERSGMAVTLRDGDGRRIAAGPSSVAGGPGDAVPSAVATVPGLGWMIEVASARGGAVTAVEQGRELAFLLLLAVLPLAAIAAEVWARGSARQVGRLADSVEEMTAGNPWAALPAGSGSEVSRLWASFRELRDRLARRTQESERMATELRSRAAALADSDQRKNEFLAMLAHELRNPIGAISTASYVVSQAGVQGRPATRSLAIIQRQVQHLSRLVDDLLDVSRITRGKIDLRHEAVELDQLVEQAVEASLPLAEAKQQELLWSPPSEPTPFYGDGTRLEQVFSNLIRNAIKFTPAKGKIEVRLSRIGDEARISVRDEGMGIPSDLLPKMFDLFIQGKQGLDRSVGGLGIGLTLVRSLVEMHGGKVTAESAGPGLGSRFTVSLPVRDEHVGQQQDLDSSAVWAR
jgi:signal transduction histidine kinase